VSLTAPVADDPDAPRFIREAAIAFLGFLAISLWYLRPIWQHFATRIAPDLGDPLFNLVVLEWGAGAIRNGWANFWNLPIFFPEQGATAYSDHLLGPAVLSVLLSPLLPNTIAAYNLLFLSSFVGCGLSTWWVLRRAGSASVCAFCGGCIFAFSSFRWDQLSHLQVLWMLWIPPVLWTFHRLLDRPNGRRAVTFALFYALHATGGCYLAYMIHVPLLVLLAQRARALRRDATPLDWRILIATGLCCAAILAAVAWPYLGRSSAQKRRPAEILRHGAAVTSYLSPSDNNLYGKFASAWRRPENTLFTGLLPTAIALGTLPWAWRRRRNPPLRPISRRHRVAIVTFGTLASLCFLVGELRTWAYARQQAFEVPHLRGYKLGVILLLSLALALALRRRWGGNWPLQFRGVPPFERALAVSTLACGLLTFPTIYLALMRNVPGLDGMRVPTRFFAFVSFGIAWFVAQQLARWQLRLPLGRRNLAAAAFACLLVVDLAPIALPWPELTAKRDLAPVYHWLATARDVTAVLELPLGEYTTYLPYMYAATLHQKPLVGGYSGFIAPHFEALRQTCCHPVPDSADLERLRGWGTSHVLVHVSRPGVIKKVLRWAKQDGIQLEFQQGDDYLFRIQRTPLVPLPQRPHSP
jgi:hypothetical protein